ncbi:MAG TPA: hypothetical protein VGM39_08080 [Kofleriaceae bacterium]|jgi:hypothetical protein
MNSDFSSWPREQEATFVVYEQTTQASQRMAWTIAGVVAGFVFLVMVGIYAGVTPVVSDISKDMNMSNLTKKEKAAAPAPAPAATTDKK